MSRPPTASGRADSAAARFAEQKSALQRRLLKADRARAGTCAADAFVVAVKRLDGYVPHSLLHDATREFAVGEGTVAYVDFLDRLTFFADGSTIVYDIVPQQARGAHSTSRPATAHATPGLPPRPPTVARSAATPRGAAALRPVDDAQSVLSAASADARSVHSARSSYDTRSLLSLGSTSGLVPHAPPPRRPGSAAYDDAASVVSRDSAYSRGSRTSRASHASIGSIGSFGSRASSAASEASSFVSEHRGSLYTDHSPMPLFARPPSPASAEQNGRMHLFLGECMNRDAHHAGTLTVQKVMEVARSVGVEDEVGTVINAGSRRAHDPVDYMGVVQACRQRLVQTPRVDHERTMSENEEALDLILRELHLYDETGDGVTGLESVAYVLQRFGMDHGTAVRAAERHVVNKPRQLVDYIRVVQSLTGDECDTIRAFYARYARGAHPEIARSRPSTSHSRSSSSRAGDMRSLLERNGVKRPPFAVDADAMRNLKAAVASLVERQARLMKAMRAVDVANSGSLSQAQFVQSMAQVGLHLNETEVKAVFRAFPRTLEGRLIYNDLFANAPNVLAERDPDAANRTTLLPPSLADLSAPKSLQTAGDVVTWSQMPTRVEREKVLYRGKIGMINDSYENWKQRAPPVRVEEPRGANRFNLVRQEVMPSKTQERIVRNNPMLVRGDVGEVKPPTSQLPSARQPDFTYGRPSKVTENINDVIAHQFRYDWMDERNAEANQPVPARRYHTKTSEMRRALVRRRIRHEAETGRPADLFKMSRFRNEPPRTQSRFEEEMDRVLA